MANIRDVAALAQVSPITVSRVFNNPERVSPATRARVEAAVEELGYIPNQIARSLRSNRTNTLAKPFLDIRCAQCGGRSQWAGLQCDLVQHR
jgi:LacI family transcriptional regulator